MRPPVRPACRIAHLRPAGRPARAGQHERASGLAAPAFRPARPASAGPGRMTTHAVGLAGSRLRLALGRGAGHVQASGGPAPAPEPLRRPARRPPAPLGSLARATGPAASAAAGAGGPRPTALPAAGARRLQCFLARGAPCPLPCPACAARLRPRAPHAATQLPATTSRCAPAPLPSEVEEVLLLVGLLPPGVREVLQAHAELPLLLEVVMDL